MDGNDSRATGSRPSWALKQGSWRVDLSPALWLPELASPEHDPWLYFAVTFSMFFFAWSPPFELISGHGNSRAH